MAVFHRDVLPLRQTEIKVACEGALCCRFFAGGFCFFSTCNTPSRQSRKNAVKSARTCCSPSSVQLLGLLGAVFEIP